MVSRGSAFAASLLVVTYLGGLPVLGERTIAPHGGLPRQNGPPAGMHRVFVDDFSEPALDMEKWNTCYPWANSGAGCTNSDNPELEWYLPLQVKVSDDALHLTASKTPTPGTTRNGTPRIYDWRSGMVTTYGSFAFTHGYVSVQARVPKGQFLWPTLWLLPTSQKWPPEIDLAATLGDDTSHVRVVFHPVSGQQHVRNVAVPDQAADWHTYAVDWERNSITWYIDGRPVSRYRGRTPSQSMYLLAALAVANFSGASPAPGAPTLASFDVRKIEVYRH